MRIVNRVTSLDHHPPTNESEYGAWIARVLARHPKFIRSMAAIIDGVLANLTAYIGIDPTTRPLIDEHWLTEALKPSQAWPNPFIANEIPAYSPGDVKAQRQFQGEEWPLAAETDRP